MLAVVMWVGGGVMLILLGLMTIGLGDPIRLAQLAKQAAFLGGAYFPPLSLMVVGGSRTDQAHPARGPLGRR
jgi:hypothetical protein